MLLTVTTTRAPATDLGYLLHKHPARVQHFPQPTGVAHVFYPEADERRCTAALLLEVDPIGLVRGRKGGEPDGFTLGQYVNDRPYAAGSLLAVALKDVFGAALTGRCDARPELAAAAIPLELTIPALPCRGGVALLRRLFEPLGWTVDATAVPLDPTRPEWGESRYVEARLTGDLVLAEALRQLYVLLPVLDDGKHYWVSTDEIDKLVRGSAGWLAGHPEKTLITARYLAHQRDLERSALARLAEVDDLDAAALDPAAPLSVDDTDAGPPRSPTLADQRRAAVIAVLRAAGAHTVADLGCGEGRLVRDLLAEPTITRVVAADVSVRALRTAAERLHLAEMTERQRARLDLFQSALTYRDDRLTGLDAAVLVEVVEHVDPWRLPALERCVFGHAAPGTVVVTTPNVERNVRYPELAAGEHRHPDHRFEWTRAQFGAWARAVGEAYGYDVQLLPVGAVDPEVGPPTQLAVLTRHASPAPDAGATA